MKRTINLPNTLTTEKTSQLMAKIEHLLKTEGVDFEVEENIKPNVDPWDELDIENIALDTEIEDLALNHDHYLYRLPKK